MPWEVHFWGAVFGVPALVLGYFSWKMNDRAARGILFALAGFFFLFFAMQWLSWYK